MIRFSEKEFEQMVAKALDGLPSCVHEKLENIAVCTEFRPSAEQLRSTGTRRGNVLLGLYEGVPRTEWGRGFGGNLPDKVTIFQDSLEQCAQTPEELKELVAGTVRHEIAHHFGFSDEDLAAS
ncbi:MAG: metallopeptidase family protein [bacterium]|nr:metallopeptidase family protein [bacterium]